MSFLNSRLVSLVCLCCNSALASRPCPANHLPCLGPYFRKYALKIVSSRPRDVIWIAQGDRSAISRVRGALPEIELDLANSIRALVPSLSCSNTLSTGSALPLAFCTWLLIFYPVEGRQQAAYCTHDRSHHFASDRTKIRQHSTAEVMSNPKPVVTREASSDAILDDNESIHSRHALKVFKYGSARSGSTSPMDSTISVNSTATPQHSSNMSEEEAAAWRGYRNKTLVRAAVQLVILFIVCSALLFVTLKVALPKIDE
jgi:hypothetical protein